MDWARDFAVVNESDLKQVFSFDPQPTTVVRLLECDEVSFVPNFYVGPLHEQCVLTLPCQTPVITSLDGKEDWNTWMHNVSYRSKRNHDFPFFPFLFIFSC